MTGFHKNLIFLKISYRSVLLISVIISTSVQFLIVEKALGQTDKDLSPIPPSLGEQVLCECSRCGECIIYYYDKDIGPNYDGNYVTGSSEMYPDAYSSSTFSQRSNHFTT